MSTSRNEKSPNARSRWYLRYHRCFNHPAKVRIERWLRFLLRLNRVQTASPTGVLYSAEYGDFIQMELLRQGQYDPATLERWNQLLEPGQIVVDVGAHVGQFALHASVATGSEGRVVAIEPNPVTFQALRKNIALNSACNVVPVLGAIARNLQVAQMAVRDAGNWGSTYRARGQMDGSDFCVLAAPLSDVLVSLGIKGIHVLKIDVEGMETEALLSLFESTLFSRPRHIIVEVIDQLLIAQGSSQSELIELLRTNRYDLRTVHGAVFQPGQELPENNLWAAAL